MPSKQEDAATQHVSPVLFMAVNGEPMSFYLRPGSAKRKLQPLIKAGGGLMPKAQQPGAVLLVDPEEKGSIPAAKAHLYVSTQYIVDCVEKDEQLNLEDYRLNPDTALRQSTRSSSSKAGSPRGKCLYSPEEDAAILNYVSKHKTEVGGNRVWQQMEKERVTGRTWQSMKHRYKTQLTKTQSESKEAETSEEDTQAADEESKEDVKNQDTDAKKSSSDPPESTDHPQALSAETEQTQINVLPAESTQPENEDAQTSSPAGEVLSMNPPTEDRKAEDTQENVEDETFKSPQPVGPQCEIDDPPIHTESTDPDTDQSQINISPEREKVSEDSQLRQPEPSPDTPSPKKMPKQKTKPVAKPDQPLRRSSRRQLELEDLPSLEPHGKKLRSLSVCVEPLPPSPPTSRKTKSAVKAAPPKETTADQPPSKRARGKCPATEAASHTAEHETQTERADEGSTSTPQKGEKKEEEKKLGILELATKEFEDDGESEDEVPHPQNPAEAAESQSTSADPPLASSGAAADAATTQSDPEPGPSLQENVHMAETRDCNHTPQTNADATTATITTTTTTTIAEPPQATSEAHLFIFDSESQEEQSQSIIGSSTVANQPPLANKDTAPSLTQDQLEEDKQRIRELMKQSNQDLVSVTRALLRTSGDFSAAFELLLNPSSFSAPFWSSSDDCLLLSADPEDRQRLLKKHGEKEVAKRIMFLEIEG